MIKSSLDRISVKVLNIEVTERSILQTHCRSFLGVEAVELKPMMLCSCVGEYGAVICSVVSVGASSSELLATSLL